MNRLNHRRVLFLSLNLNLILNLFLIPSSFSRPSILVHFMPWFQSPTVRGYWGWHWTMNHFNPETIDSMGHRAIASHFYPSTGPYDSMDPNILEYQALLMKIAGIDGVLVDWYGMENYLDYGLNNDATIAVFTEMQRAGLNFGIVYEDQTIKQMVTNNHISAENALSYGKTVMQYLQTHWFSSDTYFKLDNQPLLLTFGPQYFQTSADWDTLFSVLPTKPLFFTLDAQLSPVATGAFPWPPMSNSNASGVLTQSVLDDYLGQFYAQAIYWPYVVTSAFPGFHDIYAEAGVGPSYGYLDAMNGATFEDTYSQALSHNANVVQVVTWNDYGEGTIVEPTVEFGTQYLEMIQSARDSLEPGFPFGRMDLSIPLKVFQGRSQNPGNVPLNAAFDRLFQLVVSDQAGAARLLADSLFPTSSVGGKSAEPSRYELRQNYPNPFNPATVIRYELPVSSEVSLKVFDLLGREVAELVNGRQDPGEYMVQFDATRTQGGTSRHRGEASGVYLYRLAATPEEGKNHAAYIMIKAMELIK